MSSRNFQLNVVDVHGPVYSGRVVFVVIPGVLGELGILAGHAPLLSEMQAGELRIHPSEHQTEILFVEGGMAEVQPDTVTILADSSMRVTDIDPRLAAEKVAMVETHMRQEHSSQMDFRKAELELQKEVAKLRAYEHYQRSAQRGGMGRISYDWQRPPLEAAPHIHVEALED